MIVQGFLDELSRRLRDVNKKQWADDFLIAALNAAMNALTTVMPQAFTVNRNLILVEGSEQRIDDDLDRIISLLHNVSNVDGSARRAITKADMSVLDATHPQWRQDPIRAYIRHWMTDESDESVFYIWPPAAAGRVGELPESIDEPVDPGPLGTREDGVEGLYSATIQDLGNSSNLTIRLPDDDDRVEGNVAWSIHSGESDYDFFMTIPDTSALPATGNAAFRGNALAISDPASNGGGTILLLTEEGSTASPYIRWDDSRMTPGNTVRFRIIDASASIVQVVGVEAWVDGATQEQIDQYAIDLVAYNLREQEIADYLAVPASHIVRGTFAYTPYIDTALPPALLDEPSAPVDPGEIGDGSSAGRLFASSQTTFNNRVVLPLEHTDDTEAQSFAEAGLSQPFDMIVRIDSVDGSDLPMNYSPQRVFESGTGAGSFSYPIYSIKDDTSTAVRGNDSRWIEGQYVQGTMSGNVFTISDFNFAYDTGVTQEDIDQYVLQQAQYDIDLAEYQASVDALAVFNARDVFTVTDEIPIKRSHYQALQEFAMYYAYAVDDDLTANSGRAQRHWLAFFQLLNKQEESNLRIMQSTELTE